MKIFGGKYMKQVMIFTFLFESLMTIGLLSLDLMVWGIPIVFAQTAFVIWFNLFGLEMMFGFERKGNKTWI